MAKKSDDTAAERGGSDALACLAHDMRARLAVISGFARAMLDGTAPKDSTEKYLAVIAEEAEGLSRLAESVLTAARLESGALKAVPTRFDLAAAACRAAERFEAQAAEKGLRLEAELQSAYVFADEGLIDRVLLNLFENAVKYSPRGGTVRAAIRKTAEGVGFSICNEAEGGFEQGEDKLLTKRFYRSKSAAESGVGGTGLGLYIVQSALELNGASADVKIENGIFCVSFSLKNS